LSATPNGKNHIRRNRGSAKGDNAIEARQTSL
jgi:hypothetical protein